MPQVRPSPESSTQTGHAYQFVCDVRFSVRDSAWIHLAGELDIASAPQFKHELDRALIAAVLVVVDLRQLTFMDSAGAHVIDDAHDRARHSAQRLVIVRGPEQIDRLLDLAKLTDRLTLITLKPVLVPAPPETVPVFTDAA